MMKKLLVVLSALFLVLVFTDLMTERVNGNSGGAPTGKTGAPGEGNCTSCHNGTVNSGSGSVTIDVGSGTTGYLLGSTYSIQVEVNDNATTYGFSLVALDANGSNAGSINLTNTVNTKTITSSDSKTYVSHKNANVQVTNSWQFEWVAPGAGVGPVTFYVAGNASNGGNNNSGDKIYTSNTTITGLGVGIDKIESGINVEVFPNLFQNDIHIRGLENREAIISVYQINGALVHKSKLEGEKEKVLDLSGLNKGVYILYINDGKHVYTDKVFKSN